MCVAWAIVMIVYSLAVGSSELSLLGWLLLIPFALQDFSDWQRDKRTAARASEERKYLENLSRFVEEKLGDIDEFQEEFEELNEGEDWEPWKGN